MANHNHKNQPATFVIFGAAGDLTWRKLIPALYNLYLDHHLPEKFAIVGVDGKALKLDEYLAHLRDGIGQFSRSGPAQDATWGPFASQISVMQADFNDAAAYQKLAAELAARDKEFGATSVKVFYLATPPTVVQMIATHLRDAGLSQDKANARLVCEKPFGKDLETATALNRFLTSCFDERQIYRIDHYLGKETVQNILALRFANALFEPVWNRRYIDHVQVTVSEQVGVEQRGGYYDHSGALRDMIQNHLLQVLCLVTMEPPVSFDADEIRNKKVDVLRAVRAISHEDVHRVAVRGQYGAGQEKGQPVPAYTAEPGVAPDSNTETFAALKLFVDNWRWQGVPFYLRTGKRLAAHASEVHIQFHPVPHQSFPADAVGEIQPNRLVIKIQPDEGVVLSFHAKRPGTIMRLGTVQMDFEYKTQFKTPSPEGYETLLLDVMLGDATLFMRGDQVEAAWKVVMPVLDTWQDIPQSDMPNYPAGCWGPQAADIMIARDGRIWYAPMG